WGHRNRPPGVRRGGRWTRKRVGARADRADAAEQRPVAFHGAARAVALTEPFPNFVLATRARRPGSNSLLKFGRSAPMRNGVTSSARPRLVGLLIAVVAAVIGVGGCSVLGLGGSTGGGSSSSSGNGKKLQLPENTNYQAGQAGPS